MRVHRRRRTPATKGRTDLQIAALLMLSVWCNSATADQNWFFLRNHNPFLQVYGLPTFQAAVLTGEGEPRYRAILDIANHAESAGTPSETVVVDGESYFLTLSLRHRLRQWLEVGFDLPVIGHSNGIFDNAIERWHKIWGLSNSKRVRDSNELQISYARDGTAFYNLSSPAWGIGDLQLTAAVPVWGGNRSDGRALSVRSSLKLPTGDEKKLLGSGATDFSLGLYASTRGILVQRDLNLTGFAGILVLGKGKVVPDFQERSVGFGGIAAAWQATERISITAQFYIQGSYLDSELEEVGGRSVQAAFGGTYLFRDQQTSLSVAIVEDLFGDATTDAALHVSINWLGGNT